MSSGTPKATRTSKTLPVLVVASVIVVAVVVYGLYLTDFFSPTRSSHPLLPQATFTLIAGTNNTLSFNGTSPGPTITVANGTRVTIVLEVSSSSAFPHSWMLVPVNGTPTSTVVFSGGEIPNPILGVSPGSSVTITFVASAPGTYRYICGVDSHYELGMYGSFIVTSGGASSSSG